MIIRNIILALLASSILSGCTVVQGVVNTTGKVVGAGFAAATPNQGSDEDDE
jgi:uncharacterized protein YceK